MTERAPCVVPGCRNSSVKFAGSRYICSTHWRIVPKRLKRRDRKLCRLLWKRGDVEREDCGTFYRYHYKTKRARWLLYKSWEAMERAAIEGAAGL